MNLFLSATWRWFSSLTMVALLTGNARAQTGPGFALDFNGSSHFVSVSPGVIPPSGEFTVECWALAPIATSSARQIISQGSSGSYFNIGTDTGNKVSLGTGWLQTEVPFPFGGWHHFAVVKTSSDTFFYLDGMLKTNRGAAIANPAPGFSELRFGRQRGGSEYWQGKIDEVRIWSVARTLLQLTNNLSRRLVGNETGLQGYWRFDEGSGGTAADSSGHGNAGTIQNSPTWVLSMIPFEPTVTTSNASGMTLTGATLNGAVNPHTFNTTAWFEWGDTTNYGNVTPAANVGGGSSDVTLAENLTGLALGTAYHFRVVATNASGLVFAADRTFTTLSTNAFLSNLSTSAGDLTPVFNPGTTNYTASVSNSITSVTVTATCTDPGATMLLLHNGGYSTMVSGLPSSAVAIKAGDNELPIVVLASDGTTTKTYTLTVNRTTVLASTSTLPATGITSTNATLNGNVNANGSTAAVWFEWGVTTNYGNATNSAIILNSSSTWSVTTTLPGLTPFANYHFRVAASNSVGISYGTDQFFIAALVPPTPAPTVIAWGDDTYGQATVPADLTNASAIAAGGYFNLALRSNGTVVAWGNGTSGQTNVPPSATSIMAISAGYWHGLALRSNGTVVAWGNNSDNQTNMPSGLNGVKAIAACSFHSLAVKTNGTIVAWGYNANGQTNVPVSATNIAAVAGGYGSFALRSNGTVVAWGSTLANQANVLPTLTNISAIASGLGHALALRSNGTVVAWGDNYSGQTNLPFGLANVAAIGCGTDHSFAIESNGFIYVWGRDDLFQVSAQPNPLNGVLQVSGGASHSLALGYLNDNFADRMPLAGTNILIRASNQNATTEVGEPTHHAKPSDNSVWFTWTAPASGGVILTATNTDFTVNIPILAAYTGSTLNNLTPIASNSTDLQRARTVFTALGGQTYQIVLAGSGGGQGNAYLGLNLDPAPGNDLFQNATPVDGIYYEKTNGTFVGAGREPNEPTHGTSYAQTLWWNWTAPTNLNLSIIPIRLTADAVSFPPVFGVYTGDTIGALTSVTIAQVANGMTRTATFSAISGTTYRIALAGIQSDPDVILPLLGTFRFRLNTRALALSIQGLSSATTPTQALTFAATARVENLGSAPSGPMRVRTVVIPGISMRGDFVSSIIGSSTTQGTWLLPPLSPGQVTNLSISGIAPAPTEVLPGISSAEGYGVYADLQEQSGVSNWATMDQALVLYGIWPNFNGVPGPGGGVIRLDPDYLGLFLFNPLQSVIAIGPPTVTEGTAANYTGKAIFNDATIVNFTNTAWTASRFTIATNGRFTSGSVTSNSVVTLSAPYSSQGLVHNATTNVTVINLPPPTLTNPSLLGNAGMVFTLSGVPGRSNVIEATTNLAAPAVWLPLTTNAPASGLFNFTNFPRTNFPQRFYRAREFE